jgi:hypothetical protein
VSFDRELELVKADLPLKFKLALFFLSTFASPFTFIPFVQLMAWPTKGLSFNRENQLISTRKVLEKKKPEHEKP